jgi:hypothetical protein
MSDDAKPQPSEQIRAGLELRIASGVHAGARIALPPASEAGTATLSIGPGLDHDVVLSDAPGSARLQFEEGNWRWAEQDFGAALTPGSAWKWGEVQFGLATPGSDWSLPGTLLFDRSAPRAVPPQDAVPSGASDTAAHPTSATDAGDERATGLKQTPDESGGEPGQLRDSEASRDPVRAPARRTGLVAILATLVLVLAGALFAAFAGRKPAEPTVARPSTSEPAAPSNADPSAVMAALTGAGLDRHVRLIPLADGRIRLSGVVGDDDELDRAIAAVRRVTSRIVQGILTQREFAARVAELQLEAPQPVTLRAVPVGRVHLVDPERKGVDVRAVESWLARVLPEALAIEVPRAAPLAETASRTEGPAGGGAAFAMAPAAAVPVAAIATLPPVPSDEPPLPDIPDIRLVMGGSNPYVVLGSGEKWLPGGRVGGWYLTAIESKALILEDTLGRQLRSPR